MKGYKYTYVKFIGNDMTMRLYRGVNHKNEDYIAIRLAFDTDIDNDIDIKLSDESSEFWGTTQRSLNEIWTELFLKRDDFFHKNFSSNPFDFESDYNKVFKICRDIIVKNYAQEKNRNIKK